MGVVYGHLARRHTMRAIVIIFRHHLVSFLRGSPTSKTAKRQCTRHWYNTHVYIDGDPFASVNFLNRTIEPNDPT
jgi:hypothetical protein